MTPEDALREAERFLARRRGTDPVWTRLQDAHATGVGYAGEIVAAVRMSPWGFAHGARKAFEAAPGVRTLHLESPSRPEDYAEFARTRELERLHALHVCAARVSNPSSPEPPDHEIRDYADVPSLPGSHPIGDALIDALSASPWLSRLRAFAMDARDLSTAGVRALVRGPAFRPLVRLAFHMIERDALSILAQGASSGLRRIDLSLSGSTAGSLHELASGPLLNAVRTLRLAHPKLNADVVRALGEGGRLAAIEDLGLSHAWMDVDTVAALAAGSSDGRLRRIDLQWSKFGGRGQEAPSFARSWAGARHVDLRYADFDDATLGGWAEAGAFASAETLLLSCSGAGSAIAGRIGRRSFVPAVRHLDFGGYSEGGESLSAFLAGLDLEGLEHLRVRASGADPRSWARLASHASLGGLRTLDLSDSALGPEELRALASGRALRRLQELRLEENRPGPEGLRALLDPDAFPELRILDLGRCKLGDAEARVLAEHPGTGRIAVLHLGYNDIGPEGSQALAGSARLGRLLEIDGVPWGENHPALEAALGPRLLPREGRRGACTGPCPED